MINIESKKNCCGCGACAQICPRSCISMSADNEGFLYPTVDQNFCIKCGLCEKVCPIINRYAPMNETPSSYAAVVKDNSLRNNSSSGGAFSIMASEVLRKGGYVFGATFNTDWSVSHCVVKEEAELYRIRGSKYVQSVIGNAFVDIKKLLDQNVSVLFSGTPCQVAGLNHFLGKDYPTLITVDIVCHSIPSPLVWKHYLASVRSKSADASPDIKNITFRSKKDGWHKYGLKIEYCDGLSFEENSWDNLYMQGFLQDLYTRPSCSSCPAREYRSHSDIMLADLWGVEKYHPEWDDNKGMSLILVKTQKAKSFINEISSYFSLLECIPYHEVEDRALHAPIMLSTKAHVLRRYFWYRFGKTDLNGLIRCCLSIGKSYYSTIERIKCVLRPFYKAIKKNN